jgi:PhzF family phenazine biosynthesis protein
MQLEATMELVRIAAFSDGNRGGNPAAVALASELPAAGDMQAIARDVGYSETVFAAKIGKAWRVRYFSPAAEIPFCGHATIALGAALAMRHGDAVFSLALNDSAISVEGRRIGASVSAALQSPSTSSTGLSNEARGDAIELFGLSPSDLDDRIAPAVANAGASHLVLVLNRRRTLAAMKYDFQRGQALMRKHGWVTILLGYAELPQRFHVRNAFAFGGVYEDPATGAAAAAFAGLLRDIDWPHDGRIDLLQGDDMGVPCRLAAEIPGQRGASIRVSGTARSI